MCSFFPNIFNSHLIPPSAVWRSLPATHTSLCCSHGTAFGCLLISSSHPNCTKLCFRWDTAGNNKTHVISLSFVAMQRSWQGGRLTLKAFFSAHYEDDCRRWQAIQIPALCSLPVRSTAFSSPASQQNTVAHLHSELPGECPVLSMWASCV